jgi:glycosyltransferase involved in cell wall biosynthesis
MPEISLIIPVYNAEKHLPACMESIFAQSWQDYEVLLIDDGSTDGSTALCDEYQRRDPRVKTWHQANHGASAARNRGINLACGKYLEFVDSDDLLHSEMVQTLHRGIKEQNSDFSICGICAVYEDGRTENRNLLQRFEGVQSIPQLKKAVMENYCDIYFGSPVNKMYRTEIAKCCEFPEDISYMEDYLFNLQYFAQCKSFYVCAETLYTYQIHEESSLSGCKKSLPQDYQDMQCVANALADWLSPSVCDTETLRKINEIRLFLAMWAFMRHSYKEYREYYAFIQSVLKSSTLTEAAKVHEKNDWKRAVLCFAIKIKKPWPIGLVCVIKETKGKLS